MYQYQSIDSQPYSDYRGTVEADMRRTKNRKTAFRTGGLGCILVAAGLTMSFMGVGGVIGLILITIGAFIITLSVIGALRPCSRYEHIPSISAAVPEASPSVPVDMSSETYSWPTSSENSLRSTSTYGGPFLQPTHVQAHETWPATQEPWSTPAYTQPAFGNTRSAASAPPADPARSRDQPPAYDDLFWNRN